MEIYVPVQISIRRASVENLIQSRTTKLYEGKIMPAKDIKYKTCVGEILY